MAKRSETTMPRVRDAEGVVLVLAPASQDSQLATSALAEVKIAMHACHDLADLTQRLSEETDAVLIAEEALNPAELSPLLNELQKQAPWSDIPVIILTAAGGGDRTNTAALEIFGPAANTTLLERPLRAVTLVTTVKVALRSRRRQRQVRDLIAERETRERKLKELEERGRLAVEAADVGTFDFYPPTGVLTWSARCNEIFGLSSSAKVDYATYVNGVHPDDRHIIHETVESVLRPAGSHRYDIEYRVVRANDRREIWVSERGRAILDDRGHAVRFIGTILDITQPKTAALSLERAKREAEDANRAKDQFLAMLSHELRTPLTPVLLTLAVLRRDASLNDSLREDLEVLQRNVELEALLIDDLLDLTRIAHGKLELNHEAVNIHAAIEHALEISKPDLSKKNLTIISDLKANRHHCWADAARLQQVFWNLVKNAIKFTPTSGKVEVRTRNDADHFIIVEVEDNGIGIEPSVQPRIFDAFEQGSRSMTSKFGGLGLGLTISKRVIDLHHGTIAVHSAGVNKGATFTIKLKAMETSLLEGPEYLLDFDAIAAGPADILLVEDHQDTARVMQRILQSAGYSVTHASGVEEARKVARQGRFDLVVSDVGLPDGSGLELMRDLRTLGLKGIALSGFGTDEDVAASREAGFLEHLTKPIDWDRLRDAITRLVSTSQKD